MSWSPQQDDALRAVDAWLRDKRAPQIFRLFGYAGTGKTTLARHLADGVKGRVMFACFTGKAALVLRNKGCGAASTIHSLIYTPVEEQSFEPQFVLNAESDLKGAALVVIDECSMVDETLGKDLLSFGVKVLVLGDPAQLPPVKGAGFFTEGHQPDVMLTEVHRQARDNPIIAMSMKVREGGTLDHGVYGSSRVIRRNEIGARDVLNCDQVLVGRNRTRIAFNRRIRELLKRDGPLPQRGDKLVCLRNDREKRLLNGGLWTVDKAKHGAGCVRMDVLSDDIDGLTARVKVRNEFFLGGDEGLTWEERKYFEEFTYGYCLSVHKSQGSQWPDVVLFDESACFREDRNRWLYTAVTRAAETVTVVR